MTDKALIVPETETSVLTENGLKQWTALQSILTQKVPDSVIKTRPGRGGKTFSYVSHDWVTAQLNDAFGFDWDGEAIPDTLEIMKDLGILVFYRLEVRAGNRKIVKVEAGWKDWASGMSVGSMIKSAVSDGLRRCAMRLGLALNLYGSAEDEPTQEDVKNGLSSYAKKHLGWDARQTFDWLKEQGYTANDLVSKRDEMYEVLAKRAGKAGIDEDFNGPAEETEPEPQPEPRKQRTNLQGVGKDPAELVEQGKRKMAQRERKAWPAAIVTAILDARLAQNVPNTIGMLNLSEVIEPTDEKARIVAWAVVYQGQRDDGKDPEEAAKMADSVISNPPKAK